MGMRRRSESYSKSVFINAPFDQRYTPLFDAILFCILDCGFLPRCALEVDDGSQNRLEKIFDIIEDCRYAVHDLSRTQLDRVSKLPRFNMPLELGIFLGAKRYGVNAQATKNCIILDTERFRFQQFISDIAGQDPKAHGNDADTAIGAVRNWLLAQGAPNGVIPSAQVIQRRRSKFRRDAPMLCEWKHWDIRELTYKEKVDLMTLWIEAIPLSISTGRSPRLSRPSRR